MFMQMTRPYRKSQRGVSEEKTRQRILEAAMSLHEDVGPRHTTISGIASKAGVQRLTVYRHFQDDEALFAACTSCWLELNPLPDPAKWEGKVDPSQRCRAALLAIYSYYHVTASMWRASYRDEPHVPALREPMAQVRAYLANIAEDLFCSFKKRDGFLKATLGHAVAFSTWDDFRSQGLNDDEATDLVCRWTMALAGTGKSPNRQ